MTISERLDYIDQKMKENNEKIETILQENISLKEENKRLKRKIQLLEVLQKR